MSSAKWRLFSLGLDELITLSFIYIFSLSSFYSLYGGKKNVVKPLPDRCFTAETISGLSCDKGQKW